MLPNCLQGGRSKHCTHNRMLLGILCGGGQRLKALCPSPNETLAYIVWSSSLDLGESEGMCPGAASFPGLHAQLLLPAVRKARLKSVQTFPPLFILQATKAGHGGLGTRLFEYVCITYTRKLVQGCILMDEGGELYVWKWMYM